MTNQQGEEVSDTEETQEQEQPTIYASVVRRLAWSWEMNARRLKNETAKKAVFVCIDQLRGLADLAEGKEGEEDTSD
jgi:hypothetical protein